VERYSFWLHANGDADFAWIGVGARSQAEARPARQRRPGDKTEPGALNQNE
jgi:hypothetical protein